MLNTLDNIVFMDSIPTAPVSTSNIDTENEILIASGSSPFEYIAEKIDMAAGKAAKERNLEKSIVFQRLPPIDICVFGRAGIGKSELIKAMTHLDIPTSAQIDHVTQSLTEVTTTIGDLKFRFLGYKRY